MSKPARVTTCWVLRSDSGMYLDIGGSVTRNRCFAWRFAAKDDAKGHAHYPDNYARAETGWRPVRLYRRVRGES